MRFFYILAIFTLWGCSTTPTSAQLNAQKEIYNIVMEECLSLKSSSSSFKSKYNPDGLEYNNKKSLEENCIAVSNHKSNKVTEGPSFMDYLTVIGELAVDAGKEIGSAIIDNSDTLLTTAVAYENAKSQGSSNVDALLASIEQTTNLSSSKSICNAALPGWAQQCSRSCDEWVDNKKKNMMNSSIKENDLNLMMTGDVVGVMISKKLMHEYFYKYKHGYLKKSQADGDIIDSYRKNGSQSNTPAASRDTVLENNFVHFCIAKASAEEFEKSRSPSLPTSPFVERVMSCPGYDKRRDGTPKFSSTQTSTAASAGGFNGGLSPFLTCVKNAS